MIYYIVFIILLIIFIYLYNNNSKETFIDHSDLQKNIDNMVNILIKETIFSKNGAVNGFLFMEGDRGKLSNLIFWKKISTFYFKIIDYIEAFKNENPDNENKANEIKTKFNNDISHGLVAAVNNKNIEKENDIITKAIKYIHIINIFANESRQKSLYDIIKNAYATRTLIDTSINVSNTTQIDASITTPIDVSSTTPTKSWSRQRRLEQPKPTGRVRQTSTKKK